MNLALFGSGEFTNTVDDIDDYLIKTYKPRSIAIIPTAAGKEKDYYKWIEMAEEHYRKFNVEVIPVPVTSIEQSNKQEYSILVEKADWIFFSGGDPNYLLTVLKDNNLWETVLKKYNSGTLLSGSSAGAMIMGTYLLSSPFRDIIKPTASDWKPAFNLVPFTIFPHFDKFKRHPNVLNRLIFNSPNEIKSSWIGIDENTALLLKDTERIVLGTGQIEVH